MQQRLSVLTIGAEDLQAMINFYGNVLGWPVLTSNKDVAFFQMNGFLLSICNKTLLATLIGVDPEGQGFRRVTFGYNVNTKDEVFSLYEKLKDKVNVLKEPTELPFGGLFFYFTDVEDNIIEVAQNPFISYDIHNNVIGHQPIENL